MAQPRLLDVRIVPAAPFAGRGAPVTATNPQPGEPGTGGDGPKPSDLRRWLKWVLLALVLLIAVLTASVALSRCGPDDGPSGGEPEGMAVVIEAPAPH